MSIKREQRKIERTPEEQARIDAIRKKYEEQKPGPDQLIASGEYEGPVQAGAYWEVRRIMAELKAERERQELTLADLAEESGLDKGAISKLETGKQVNPTVDTLARLAAGLGMNLGLTLRREGATTADQVACDDPDANQTTCQESLEAAAQWKVYRESVQAHLRGTPDYEMWLRPTLTVEDFIPKFIPEAHLPGDISEEEAALIKMYLRNVVSVRRQAIAEHLRVAQAESEFMVQHFAKAARVVCLHRSAQTEGKDEEKADEPRISRKGRRQD